jgi:hypothetical protein
MLRVKQKLKLYENSGKCESASKLKKYYHTGVQSVTQLQTKASQWGLQRTVVVALDHERDHSERK